MEIVRETIIIPDEKQINIPFYNRKLMEDEGHGLGIKVFSDKYHLGLSCESLGLKENDYHDMSWFVETAKLGHLVIQKDENIILYVPPVLTSNQYRYLLEIKNMIGKYGPNVHAVSLFCENGKFYHDDLDDLIHEYENKQVDILYKELRKKYIPNKDSYILIVPDEEQLVIENGIYFQEFDSNIGHAKMFQLFCMLHMLPIRVPEETGNPWAKELANNDFLVVKKETDEIYLFIPRKLSPNQIKWLNDNKNYLANFQYLEAGIYLDDYRYREIFRDEEPYKRKSVSELIEEIYREIDKKIENSKKR